MTKAELKMLEKMFAAEIDAALSKAPVTRVFQSRSKVIEVLREQGMVEPIEVTLRGRFPVVVKGWGLTMLGHATYCFSCDDELSPQK